MSNAHEKITKTKIKVAIHFHHIVLRTMKVNSDWVLSFYSA